MSDTRCVALEEADLVSVNARAYNPRDLLDHIGVLCISVRVETCGCLAREVMNIYRYQRVSRPSILAECKLAHLEFNKRLE